MPHTGRVFDYFNNGLTAEIAQLKPKSLLYVGWRGDCNGWWNTRFVQELGIEQIGIIEIWEPNFNAAKNAFPNSKVIHGDVRKIEQYVVPGEFDIIFWDHGPEHVSNQDLAECTPRLFAHAGKALLYCCPWGSWPQGAENGNEAEVHYDVEDTFLRELGFSVQTFGRSGQMHEGELIGLMVK